MIYESSDTFLLYLKTFRGKNNDFEKHFMILPLRLRSNKFMDWGKLLEKKSLFNKQGQKHPLDTPKRMIERRRER